MTAAASSAGGAVRLGDGTGPEVPALRFEHVSMVFPDGTHALDDVSFEVRRGEFVTIVGPSGCGKSTVLRIASGLLRCTAGGYQLADPNIGYVFQDATLLPWRTVQKNVELFAELHGIAKPERTKKATEAIKLVGLRGFERSYPRRLSGGMRMRASLARSLVLNPQLFFFDEPFGALDEITREKLNEELLRLFILEHFGGLFITHSIIEAVYLSTRVLVMSARPGRLVAEFEVPFAYPRREDLRFDPAFAELSGKVSHALREAHT
jgi:NitT/TauT family transport system ATP-binding protein